MAVSNDTRAAIGVNVRNCRAEFADILAADFTATTRSGQSLRTLSSSRPLNTRSHFSEFVLQFFGRTGQHASARGGRPLGHPFNPETATPRAPAAEARMLASRGRSAGA